MSSDDRHTIAKEHLEQYLATQSDFTFELRVLNLMIAKRFACEHAGSYDDPVSRKPRQFDIRASRQRGSLWVHLAIECKNLRSSNPLLVLSVPRRPKEAYHEIIFSFPPDADPLVPSALQGHAESIRWEGGRSFYEPRQPVGKSCAQVMRKASGQLIGTDSDVYERWAQAISSAHDLADRACTDSERSYGSKAVSVVFPVVVVPDDTLWVATFSETGEPSEGPSPAVRCSYFVDKTLQPADRLGGVWYSVSHVEFVTLRGLSDLADRLSDPDDLDEILRPREVQAAMEAKRKS